MNVNVGKERVSAPPRQKKQTELGRRNNRNQLICDGSRPDCSYGYKPSIKLLMYFSMLV